MVVTETAFMITIHIFEYIYIYTYIYFCITKIICTINKLKEINLAKYTAVTI